MIHSFTVPWSLSLISFCKTFENEKQNSCQLSFEWSHFGFYPRRQTLGPPSQIAAQILLSFEWSHLARPNWLWGEKVCFLLCRKLELSFVLLFAAPRSRTGQFQGVLPWWQYFNQPPARHGPKECIFNNLLKRSLQDRCKRTRKSDGGRK